MQDRSATSENASRRDFLKASSVAAVGAGVLGSLSHLPGAYAGGDDTIRVGLIGCGGRGSGRRRASPQNQGKRQTRRDGGRFRRPSRRLAQRHPQAIRRPTGRVAVDDANKFVGFFDAYQKVLNAGVDLVILATPPGFRRSTSKPP